MDRVAQGVARLTREAPKSKIVINLSLDGVGADHDTIRGVPGNYVKLRESYAALEIAPRGHLEAGGAEPDEQDGRDHQRAEQVADPPGGPDGRKCRAD